MAVGHPGFEIVAQALRAGAARACIGGPPVDVMAAPVLGAARACIGGPPVDVMTAPVLGAARGCIGGPPPVEVS